MATVTVQWYQSPDAVTASLRLKPLPQHTSDYVTLLLEEQYCAIQIADSVVWECHLAGRIVPGKSKLSLGKVRWEVKLHKADPIQWSDYEAEPPAKRPALEDVSGSLTAGDSSPPVPSLPSHAPEKPFIVEDLTYVTHLPHDWYNTGEDVLTVKVTLDGVRGEGCRVEFQEHSLELRFQTSDKKFLRSYPGASGSTIFVWNITLFGPISPQDCSYFVQPDCVKLSLRKSTRARWKALERSQHTKAISSSSKTFPPGPANQMQGNEQLTNRNIDDIIQNDLGAISDIATASTYRGGDDAPASEVQSSPCSVSSPTQSIQNTLQHNQTSDRYTSSQRSSPTSPKQGNPVRTSPEGHTYQPSLPGGGHSTNIPKTTSTGSEYTTSAKRATPVTSKYTASYLLPSELESSNPSYRYNQLQRPSLTGLCNLGNTCFMNSVIQCLSNTQELRDFFINGHYLADINKQNPLGFQGELAKCFSGIIRKLWSGEYTYFPPKKLMSVIATKNSSFAERSQHDSHELMSYLLDGLHEDLNRIKDKPLTKPVEMEGRPDAEVAAKSWRVHQLRNNSFFVDKFQGQFKSTLVCPVCSKVSVTFDPFMSLSVPIPKNLRHLPVIFVPQNPDSMPKQYVLKLPPDANLELLKASVARKTGIPMIHLRVFEAYNGKFQTLMSHNQHPIKSIGDNDIIIVSEVLSEKEARGDVIEMNVIQRVQLPIFPTKCTSCGRQATEGKKLQRCSKCKAVGYCNRDCQGQDWEAHKLQCRQGRPTPVGLPFVVSLPATKFTYANLATFAEKFARRSVDYRRKEESNPEHVREYTVGAQGSSVDIQESTDSAQKSADHTQECTEGVTALQLRQWKPMYLLTPVDRYGDSIDGVSYLDSEGETLLSVDSHFLAMDWRNNPKDEDSVVVTPKPAMDFEDDKDGRSSLQGPITLEQCLELFTEPELLSKEEAWYCPRCKEHRQATKQISVWKVPDLLVIHLKRFSFHTNSRYLWRDKIDNMVTFPLRGLDMSPYMLGDAAKLIPTDSLPLYDLYAVVYHYGSTYIGHYISSAKPPPSKELKKNEWLYYDDEKVLRWSEDEVVNKEAYILFYCRRDCSQHRTKL